MAVYLRARGGTMDYIDDFSGPEGLSPRTRRNPAGPDKDSLSRRSISAHAEEPSRTRTDAPRTAVYLRARGGTVF
ncbi:Hypothetical protein GbCGDNIH7_7112c [Granulibacter bethesdensis]|nr:Hypothetical protein GbCGDNIH7_7112c [Granulibacter bethesdensis]